VGKVRGRYVFSLLILMLIVGCSSSEQSVEERASELAPEEIAAWVDGVPIALDERISGKMKERAVQAAIDRFLLARAAREQKLDQLPEVREKLGAIRREARLREERVLLQAFQDALPPVKEISEEELRAEYEKRKEDFREPQIRLRQRKFESEAEARRWDSQLGRDGRLAEEGSVDLLPVSLKRAARDLFPAILALRVVGDRVVVRRNEGWVLVELVEKVPAGIARFEDVRERMEKRLRTRRRYDRLHDEVKKLREQAVIRVNEEFVAKPRR